MPDDPPPTDPGHMTRRTLLPPARSVPPARPSAAVELTGVTKSFGSTIALRDVDVQIETAQSVAVVGPSGSGKSTLAHCIAGLLVPDRGAVRIDDIEVSALSEERRSSLRLRSIGMVFQAGHLLGDLTAVENAALGAMFAGRSRREAVRAASDWFPALGLEGLEQRRPGELSGGQAQRVAIIRALVQRPRLVIADEPTAALDRSTSAAVMRLLVGLCRDTGAALVVVTHDADVAASYRLRSAAGGMSGSRELWRVVAAVRSGRAVTRWSMGAAFAVATMALL
eukprot:gene18917-38048_t